MSEPAMSMITTRVIIDMIEIIASKPLVAHIERSPSLMSALL